MPQPYDLPQPGDVLGDKYRLTRIVATGGMARVYAAVHVRLGQNVAIKVLLPEVAAHAEFCGRFEREARAAAQLRSPHVARVLDVELLPGGLPYIVMELLEGRDLECELRLRGRLPSDEAVSYLLQACAAMDEAHRRGTVHRDLKPSNLFLSKGNDEAEEYTLKVLDFGISKVLEQGPVPVVTTVLSLLGTPHYMSPEQVRSARDVDARSDVWSLGVILYELVTGQLPFTGENVASVVSSIAADQPVPLRAIDPGISPDLDAIVMKALRKDRGARFSDAGTLARALRDLSKGGPTRPGRARAGHPPPGLAGGEGRVHDLATQSGQGTTTLLLPHGNSNEPRWSRRGRVLTVGGGSVALALLATVTTVGIRTTRVGRQAAKLGSASAVQASVAPDRKARIEATGSAPVRDVTAAPAPSADDQRPPLLIDAGSAFRPDAKEKRRSRRTTPPVAKQAATATKPMTTNATATPSKATAIPAASRARSVPRETDLPIDPG